MGRNGTITYRNIRDREGRFEVSVSVHDKQFFAAVDHEDAAAVLTSAILLALAVLMQSEHWSDEALRSMSEFMKDMRQSLFR